MVTFQRAPARIQGRLDINSVFIESPTHHTTPKIPLVTPAREELSRLSKSLALCVSHLRTITLIIPYCEHQFLSKAIKKKKQYKPNSLILARELCRGNSALGTVESRCAWMMYIDLDYTISEALINVFIPSLNPPLAEPAHPLYPPF